MRYYDRGFTSRSLTDPDARLGDAVFFDMHSPEGKGPDTFGCFCDYFENCTIFGPADINDAAEVYSMGGIMGYSPQINATNFG